MNDSTKDRMPGAHIESARDLEYHYWWHRHRLNLASAWLKGRMDRPDILDLGCGTGGFMDQLKDCLSARRTRGMDASPSALSACREKGLDVEYIDFAEPPPAPEKIYDIVTAMDVLEHLVDDTSLIQTAYRCLHGGGYLLVSVPALPWLYSSWDKELGHCRRYTRAGLLKLFSDAEWDIIRCSYAFSFVLLPSIFRRLLGRPYTGENCVFPPVPAWLNHVLIGMSAMEIVWLKYLPLPIGVSLYVLIRKKYITHG